MKTLYLLTIVALLLAACAPAQSPQATDTVVPSTPTPTEQKQVAPVQDTPTVDSPLSRLPTDLRTLIEQVDSKTSDGIAYTYTPYTGSVLLTHPSAQAKVHQKGNLIRLEVIPPARYDKTNLVNIVILDTVKKTTMGYCIQSVNMCGKIPDERPTLYSYDEYMFPLPLSWYDNAKNLESLGAGESIDGRQTLKISGTIDNEPATFWLDRFSGVPVKVIYKGNTYTYKNLILGVSDAEMKV